MENQIKMINIKYQRKDKKKLKSIAFKILIIILISQSLNRNQKANLIKKLEA
jgi:hypothetical protein